MSNDKEQIVKDFIEEAINKFNAKYFVLIDKVSYMTVFVVNKDSQKTSQSISEFIDKELNGKVIDVRNVGDRIDIEIDKQIYYLFDYTDGVIECK